MWNKEEIEFLLLLRVMHVWRRRWSATDEMDRRQKVHLNGNGAESTRGRRTKKCNGSVQEDSEED
jgi:hypothetical protein